MADDDEIDILGDFSFDSCLAQNNQGIPSCSNREDTVHPQWLLDSSETNNWYDKQSKDSLQSLRHYSGPSRKLLGDHSLRKYKSQPRTVWSQTERDTLAREMKKYGRNIKKISQTLQSKTEVEIQALIDVEFGVHLEPSSYGLDNFVDHAETPSVVQEEIVTDDSHIKKVVIFAPAAKITKHPFRKKTYNTKPRNSLLKPNILSDRTMILDSSEIFYDEEMTVGSTESIGSELDLSDVVSKNIAKHQAKVKAEKKIGNHRRKVSRSYEKGPRSKDLMKSPQGRQRKDSNLSDDSVKSPKMQIVLGSGQALPVSEGEQVIKIEKKKDSEPESDIEIDIDSDNEGTIKKSQVKSVARPVEEPIAVPLRKFEPMPRRQKKINLDGGGGYTIMHTDAGDLVEVGSEPRREKQPKNQPIHLIRCRVYNADKPAPYSVLLHVSTLILMDAHAHTSRGEVMGLTGGSVQAPTTNGDVMSMARGPVCAPTLTVSAYQRAAAAAGSTHCDMDPVSQSVAAETLSSLGLQVCGWHHSHPLFPCAPSALDLQSQRTLQRALERRVPLLAFITSQHWPPGRQASQYKCLRVEDNEPNSDTPTGYQFSVKLVPDITAEKLPSFLEELRLVLRHDKEDALTVDLVNDVCPQARMTYLEKCISSVCHHMRSAGYADDNPIVPQLLQGIRDVLR